MSKEIYISSTPHETRLAIVEDDALTEIYYERENEYTLAGSIYNGRVTRVLPGMQSAFVDIGLERDAFLYITDFMEEVPDSADFDTPTGSEQQRTPRIGSGEAPAPEREDRGSSRGRRGGRDRNRGDRDGERSATPTPVPAAYPEHEDDTQAFVAESHPAAPDSTEQDAGEAGSAEGNRRWRGRRGRRRGRGALPGTPEAGSSSGAPVVSSDADADGETLFEGGAPFEAPATQPPAYEMDAATETSYPAAPERSDRREGRRGRSDRDRGRSDRGRSREAGGRTEGSSEPRGDRGQRAPRGFTPSRSLYGVEDAEPSSGEPIVLPGESLSKYRKGGDSSAPDASNAAPAPPAIVNLARPANLVEVAEGWDGSDVLPGETLSRRRSPEPRASQSEGRRSAPFNREPRRDRQSAPAPETLIPTAPTLAQEAAPAVESAEPLPTPVEVAAAESVAPIAAAPEPAEYEPGEGSVSYRVDPLAPAEFRHTAPTLEPVAEETTAVEAAPIETTAVETTAVETTPVETTSAPETHGSIAHSITPGPGESFAPLTISEPAVHAESAAIPEPQPEQAQESAPAEISLAGAHFAPAEAHPAPTASFTSEESLPTHDVTSISDSGNMHSHVESTDAPATAEVSGDADEDVFAPGDGVLDEEVLDEEEPAGASLQASAFEELDELEEEHVEGSADLGTLLRDMSIDQMTRSNLEPGDDLEDFEEDELEEDFEQESQEEAGLHEHDSLETHQEQTEEYEAAEKHQQSFTSDEGTAYETEPARAPETDPTRPFDRGRRDRRDPRRNGGRDRRGGQSSGDRGGRGRHSVQSTNLPAISDLLKPGQEILVQIAKEPIAKKGARITSHIALPGRFLVFMPTVNHTGVSRKIESDSERRRLKEILLSEKGDASGGFIVRTAASGATEEELRSDLRFLLNLWSDIKSRSESSKSPALIYHDLNLIERILRDQVTDNFSAVWVDSEGEYERVLRFLQRFQPSLIRRVKLYLKDTPLFEQFGISEEINKALRSKVWLKSGGSIVINQTEALVAIDINTGKYVGKTARLEDTIVKTNLDAIPEIVRQIRLRDLGGIIIIDFIDMDERKNRNRVMAALEDELKKDRAPSKVLQFNDFGLVAITRKRVKQSLERTLSAPCNVCQGTGMTKSPITICNDIYVEMRKMHKHLERGDVMLRVHPEVVKQLKASNARWLHEMEEMAGKTILVKSDPSLHPEQFDIH